MSTSLVWKGINSFDVNAQEEGPPKEGKKSGKSKTKADLPTQRHGLKKAAKKLKKDKRSQRSTLLGEKGDLLPSLRRSSHPRKKSSDCQLNDKIKFLQSIGHADPSAVTAYSKVLARATRAPSKIPVSSSEPTSVFTDQDFINFEKNYRAE